MAVLVDGFRSMFCYRVGESVTTPVPRLALTGAVVHGFGGHRANRFYADYYDSEQGEILLQWGRRKVRWTDLEIENIVLDRWRRRFVLKVRGAVCDDFTYRRRRALAYGWSGEPPSEVDLDYFLTLATRPAQWSDQAQPGYARGWPANNA